MALNILRAGVLTTVQDLGRRGFQRHGVPVSGAMDCYALRVANALVGNSEDEAGLEMTLDGCAFESDEELLFAICGADFSPMIGEASVPMFRPVWAKAGSRVTFGSARWGSRSYLAVAGGIDVPLVLGSRSTYLRAAFGGLQGRALRRGDRLGVAPRKRLPYPRLREAALGSQQGFASAHWAATALAGRVQRAPQVLRFVPGGQWETLPADGRTQFLTTEFRIGGASDRMGYRLEAAALAATQAELLSQAVAFGTIQLPPNGQPIVLMADRQVTGGYPRLGEVASVDLGLAAQLKPGDRVRFEKVSLSQAQQAWMAQEQAYAELRRSVQGHMADA